MDALAAYGSDTDDSGPESSPILKTSNASATPSTPTSAAGFKITSLSSMLPPPKSQRSSTATITASKTSSSATSAPKTSKYHSLPTLESDSDSDEEESVFRKKARLNEAAKSTGSGVNALFAMLPAPKSGSGVSSASASTTPSSAKPVASKPSFMPRTVKKPTPAHVKRAAIAVTDGGDEDEAEEDEEEPVSFFPLGAAATAAPTAPSSGKTASNTYIPFFFDKKPLTTEEKQAQNQSVVDVSTTNEQYAYNYNEQYAYPTNDQDAYQTNDQYAYQSYDTYGSHGTNTFTQSAAGGSQRSNMIELDDVGLQKLGMRKARDIPINVIDVSARDQMSQAQHVRHAMSGSNSQPKPTDLSSIEHLKPTAALKRKHNIMSLAYQAKANEAQLSASWAASRRTKAETQSKYGF